MEPTIRQVRIVGSLHIYWSPKFQRYIARAWPKGNGGDTPKRKAARAEFSAVQQLIKGVNGTDVAAAKTWTKGTPFLVRDALAMAAYGTLVFAYTQDKHFWEGLRVAQQEINTLLDSISHRQGVILFRGNDAWYALDVGIAGQVLSTNGPNSDPEWIDAALPADIPPPPHPGYVTGRWYGPEAQGLTTTNTPANTIQAWPWYVPLDTTFAAAKISITGAVVGSHITGGLYANASGSPGALLKKFTTFDTGTTGDKIDNTIAVTLARGWYWLCLAYSSAVTIRVYASAASAFALGNNASNLAGGILQATRTYTNGVLPDPFPAATLFSGANIPQLLLQH